jgi:hypothetical protein
MSRVPKLKFVGLAVTHWAVAVRALMTSNGSAQIKNHRAVLELGFISFIIALGAKRWGLEAQGFPFDCRAV